MAKGRLNCRDLQVDQVRKQSIVIRWFRMEGPSLKDKRYSGDNRLISPKSSHRRGGLAPRCRLGHILGLEEGSKGWAVRPLKWHASWVQNVVRQFGLYLSWALEFCVVLTLVREDRVGQTSGLPVCRQVHRWVSESGLDKR